MSLAKELVADLLVLRCSDKRRYTALGKKAIRACFPLLPHAEAYLRDMIKDQAVPHLADYALWMAFVHVCHDDCTEILDEIIRLKTRDPEAYLIPHAIVWLQQLENRYSVD